MSGQSHLLRTRRFLPLFVTQFLGAFNDNTFKNALVVLLAFHAASWSSLQPGLLANLAAGVFILPFFLFSASAGQMADKFDKARLARAVKLLEIGIMGVAGLGFWLQSLTGLFAALFLLGLHSTLFGPVKYALLPQHLHAHELIGGNALVEAGTFAAILLGTLAGGLLAGLGEPLAIAGLGALIALAGYVASRAIPPAPAPAPDLRLNPNPLTETWRTLGYARENRAVFQAILGISWFWLFGALFLAQFPAYAKDVLHGDEAAVTLLLATFTIGVGLGSLACEKLAAGRVEIGLVPFGSIGLSLFALDLALASPTGILGGAPFGLEALLARPGTWRILVDLSLVGLFGGFFIVPLYALMQERSAPERRARIIAGNNIVNALFMVLGSLIAAALLAAGWSIPHLFAAAALANAVVALHIYRQVPEFLVRFLVWLLVHSIGRIRARGFEHLPATGAARILTETPLSPAGALMLMAACDRPMRFVLPKAMARHRLFAWIIRQADGRFVDPGAVSPTLADIEQRGHIALIAASRDEMATLETRANEFEVTLRRPAGAGALLGLPAPTLLTLAPRAKG